ncbi:MAG: hypothetical protein ACX930_12195 [Erythrobacter sp.]
MSGASGDGRRLAEAAAEFIGSPFRLHGRDRATGLDCIGLLFASMARIGREPVAPEGYRLRNSDPERWFAFARYSGLVDAGETGVMEGDVLVIEPGPGQQHLLIAETHKYAIHAHAGLRRVVRQPCDFTAEPLAHWRLT